MTTAPLQPYLSFDLPVSRPLIPLEAAMVMLDRDEDQVLYLIEAGGLTFAWDIRSQDAERREVRVWRDCIRAHVNGDPQPELPEDQVINSFLPHTAEVRSTQLRRIFTASQGHVQNLINQGLVCGLNEACTGPNGYVRVERGSIINFLRSRRII